MRLKYNLLSNLKFNTENYSSKYKNNINTFS